MIGTFDSTFVDVDFKEEASKAKKLMGMASPEDKEVKRCGLLPAFGDKFEVYPRSELKDRIRRNDDQGAWPCRMIRHLHDQDGEPSCVYNMAALMKQLVTYRMTGRSIKFSAISGYRHNGTPRSGSSVPGSAIWLQDEGLLPSDIPENQWLRERGIILHPDNGYGRREAEGFKITRNMFRIQEWFRITTVEEWFTALIKGFACGGGREGHAILHVEAGIDGANLISIYAQSWGIPWGFTMPTLVGDVKSFGADSERKIRTMVRNGAYACRVPVSSDFLMSL